ncbi:sensor histidine kinase [Corynebacterium confusum]|uniref:sensor histidine kinase n=1 Tax=Corynebacterium confusum TaxID=71254 RepID=UPI0025B4AC1E|nr:histidine kinase [Corynebacterium confusum]WJY89239.1 Sensor histidine kinase DesK [Corynebacterium confusum]
MKHLTQPARRGLRAGDIALGVVASVLAAAYVLMALPHTSGSDIAWAVLSVGFAAFMFVWRSRPRLSACAFLVLLGGWAAVFLWALPENSGITPWIVTAPMAVAVVARYERNRLFARGILTAFAAGSFLSPLMWTWDEALVLHYRTGLDIIVTVAVHWLVLGFAYVVGTRYRARETERSLREAARQEQLRAAREEERLHLAREIHDALAHSLTLIKVQADAGLIASQSDPQQAQQALGQVRDSTAGALRDVRDIVGMLRDDSPVLPSTKQQLRPGPQIEDLPAVVNKFRDAGLRITAELPAEGTARDRSIATVTQLAIDRIVTEALNNVVRHQGPRSSAHVSLSLNTTDAAVTVSSTAASPAGNVSSPAQCAEGTGTGLAGLRERVRMLGGSFSAEHCGAEFVVTARLPLRPDSEES